MRSAHSPSSPEQQIALSEARLNEAQRIAKIGNWEWDIVSGSEWWSEELYRILEVDPRRQKASLKLFLELVHPQDRERVKQSAERAVAEGAHHSVDVRVVMRDGSEKIVNSQGVVTFDKQGRPLRMSGTLQDITNRKAIETTLRLIEQRYKEAQRLAKIGNWEWNLVTGENWWSEELYEILEEDPEAYAASFENFIARVHPDDRRFLIEGRDNIPTDPEESHRTRSIRLVVRGGRTKVAELRISVRYDEFHEPSAVIGTIRDVTERWELETELRESQERYFNTVELAAVGIAHVEAGGRFIWVNKHFCQMLGYSKDELLTRTTKDISHPEDVSVTDEERAKLHAGFIDSLTWEKRYLRKDGATIWVRITSTLKRNVQGAPLYDISIVEDISDRKIAEARIRYLATHDEMTGLPNRATFGELLNHAIETTRRRDGQCAVLFIDLDRFKVINDSLGHEAGDQLLKTMSARLSRCMRKSDMVARLGGDEFVVLLEDSNDAAAAAEVAKKILAAVMEPVEIMGQECRVTASVGIARYPDDARDALTLMKHADVAMYLAKEEGKNNYQFYSLATSAMSVERLTLETQLSRALQQREFSIQYQPQVSLKSGAIVGTEALLRWWNPLLGTVSPAQFIPIAEDTGLIVPIGKWILKTACEQNVEWQRRGLPPIVMSVNLSPRQFKDGNLLKDIAAALEETGMAPELLELEIT
ncbi:MAG TPA: diguanylate cyclase, partial [Gammaproteobacteria bacterium]|nr:diguanylate cyclase [Gammaproteobacteria bacterium]